VHLQYSGYQRNTLQASKPLRTSFTHASSNVIHSGFEAPSLDGITSSQNPGALTFLRLCIQSVLFSRAVNADTYKVTGFHDHLAFIANFHSFKALARVDPVGGIKI
jgi:hypothetical protein